MSRADDTSKFQHPIVLAADEHYCTQMIYHHHQLKMYWKVLAEWQDMVNKMMVIVSSFAADGQEKAPTHHPEHYYTATLRENGPPQTTTCQILHLSLQNGGMVSKHRVFVAMWSQHQPQRRSSLMGRNIPAALIHCSSMNREQNLRYS